MKKIKEIYRHSFGEDSEFENKLFELCGDYIERLEINGVTVSFLFLLPCQIQWGENSKKAYYLFAAATHRDYRKKGYMGRLLEKVKGSVTDPIILRPAEENLVEYYKKFGFITLTGQDKEPQKANLYPTEQFLNLSGQTEKTAEGKFTLMAYNLPEEIKEIYFPYTMP